MLAKGPAVLPGHSMCVISVVIDGKSDWHINSLMAPRSSFAHSSAPRTAMFVYGRLRLFFHCPCTGGDVRKGRGSWVLQGVEKVEIPQPPGSCWRGCRCFAVWVFCRLCQFLQHLSSSRHLFGSFTGYLRAYPTYFSKIRRKAVRTCWWCS